MSESAESEASTPPSKSPKRLWWVCPNIEGVACP